MSAFDYLLLRHALAILLVLPAVAAAQVSKTLHISGAVEKPRTLTVEDLKSRPPKSISDIRMIDEGGRREQRTQIFTGVLLRDLIDQTQVVERRRRDLRTSVVVATATDGYRAVFSWAELYLSATGDGALVYYELDGKPLDEREGLIALISMKDTRTGARHVRWLQKIEVVPVGP